MQLSTLLAQRYRFDAKLGEGGMGAVSRAHQRVADWMQQQLLGADGNR